MDEKLPQSLAEIRADSTLRRGIADAGRAYFREIYLQSESRKEISRKLSPILHQLGLRVVRNEDQDPTQVGAAEELLADLQITKERLTHLVEQMRGAILENLRQILPSSVFDEIPDIVMADFLDEIQPSMLSIEISYKLNTLVRRST